MTVEHRVWPDNPKPSKEDIERMYKCAYYIDRTFFCPADVSDLGIDIVRLKEFGEVVMRKPLAQLQKRTPELWGRMSRGQKMMFLYSYFTQFINASSAVLNAIEPLIGNCMAERHALNSVLKTLNRKFPVELEEKIKEGFGKEWSL